MGDIKTHREIFELYVKPQIPAGTDPIYVELGNYLTDVSQFRDPPAHVGGKRAVWNAGRADKWGLRFAWLANFIDMDGYLDAVMGRPDPADPKGQTRRPHGQLAAFINEVVFVYSLERPPWRTANHPAAYAIDPPEFRRLYTGHFTQYYPHEHLDLPPFPKGRLDNYKASEVSTAGVPRKVTSYLEDHVVYVSNLLTALERDWARAGAAGPLSPTVEHDLLVRLGHASHAVEDFYFHSNFSDLAWGPGDPPPFTPPPPDHPGEPEIPPPDSPRWRRLHYRRRRRPVFGSDGETFSTSESLPGADLVFTGSFGSEDIFHTILDAIGFIAAEPAFDAAQFVDGIVVACGSDNPLPALLVAFANVPAGQEREAFSALLHQMAFGDEREQAQALKAYRCLVEHRALDTAFQEMARRGIVHQLSADAVGRACDIERKLFGEWSTIGLGALGLVQSILVTAKERVEASKKRSDELDTANAGEGATAIDQRTGYGPSDNDASGERIGTHSLMAKDSPRKQPLRTESIRLGGFAASYVAKTLVAQRTAPVGAGVDWEQLLRHFVTHPEQAAGAPGNPWWKPVLTWADPTTGRPPEQHIVAPVTDAALVTTRADEPTRQGLEQAYNDLVEEFQARYRSAVNVDWVIDSAINGAILGIAPGLIGGLSADNRSGGGVVLATFLGAVLTGGGAAGGAAIGNAIGDEGPAPVICMLVGLTGGAVGSGFLGKAIGGI